jgi:phenylpyruvate tautomerase PptA (4-oxalocrotonate tautomerase family)
MPIIIVKSIKGAVLTSDEQKRELLKKMTDTFISVVGEVARPFTYCLIEETPMYEWALAGAPLPDFNFLTGPEFRGMKDNADAIMLAYMAQQAQAAKEAPQQHDERAARARSIWAGEDK